MLVSHFFSWLCLRVGGETVGLCQEDDGDGRTIKRVLITHNGLVQTVLVAPAAIADKMCNVHGCSRARGWYPLTCAAGYTCRAPSVILPDGSSPKCLLIPS